jgi:magnesium-transporting ATPase (P-type)
LWNNETALRQQVADLQHIFYHRIISKMDDSFLLTTKQVADYFDVDPRFGLNKGQVAKFSEKYGKNSLPEDEKTPLWKMILEQFQDQLVIILMVAAVISFVLAFFEEKHPGAEEGLFHSCLISNF